MTPDRAPDDGRMKGGAPATAPAEPPTARALWPTFMRRTLEEEALRLAQREPAPAK